MYRNLEEAKDGAMCVLGGVQPRDSNKFKNRGWKQESQGPEVGKVQSRRPDNVLRCAAVFVVVVQSLSCVQLFCHPMDCSPLGSSLHGISPAKILDWVAISFSRGSS